MLASLNACNRLFVNRAVTGDRDLAHFSLTGLKSQVLGPVERLVEGKHTEHIQVRVRASVGCSSEPIELWSMS